MKKFKFDCKIKRQVKNIYKMLKYGFLEDTHIKGQNIKYGDDKKQYYKIFTNVNNKKLTIFFIHGGGWWQGSPTLYSGVGKFFAKRGYTTVLVGYRLVPKATYPCQVEDCFEALKHYINTYNTKEIIVGGYSAGSDLASRLIYDNERQDKYEIDARVLKGFFSIAGVLDFTKCNSKGSKKLIKNYLNGKDMLLCNPINLLNYFNNIPVICIHGSKDSLISLENSISFICKLKKLRNKSILKVIKGIDHEHAIDIARGPGNKYSSYLLDFLEDICNTE